jgi:hypothetical protein
MDAPEASILVAQPLRETGMPSWDEGDDRLPDDDKAALEAAMRQALEDATEALMDSAPDANGYHHTSPLDLHRMIPKRLPHEEQQIRFDMILEMFREAFYDVALDAVLERTDTGIMTLRVRIRPRN